MVERKQEIGPLGSKPDLKVKTKKESTMYMTVQTKAPVATLPVGCEKKKKEEGAKDLSGGL